jgi:hypothetical protein
MTHDSHINATTLTTAKPQSTRSSQFQAEYAFCDPPFPGAEVNPFPLTRPRETSSSPTESNRSVLVKTMVIGIPHLRNDQCKNHPASTLHLLVFKEIPGPTDSLVMRQNPLG